MEKINELDKTPKDPNTPDSQKFLRQLHQDMVELNKNFKQWMVDNGIWEKYEADRSNQKR